MVRQRISKTIGAQGKPNRGLVSVKRNKTKINEITHVRSIP